MLRRLLDAAERLRHDGHVRQLAGAGAVSIAVKIGSAGLTYLMFVALARVMTVADYGQFSFEFNLATFLCFVAGFGLHNAILRWLPEYGAAGEPELQRRVFAWSLRVTLMGSALTLLAVALAFAGIGLVMGRVDYALASMLLIVPLAFAELLSAGLRTRGSLLWSLLPKDIVWRVLVLAWCAWLAAGSRKVDAPVAIGVLTATLSLLVLAQLAVFARRSGGLGPLLSRADERSAAWVRTAIPIWISGILISLIQYMDVVLVGMLRGPVDTAIYFTAARTAGLMSLVLIASNMVCAPIISRMFHGDGRHELQRMLKINAVGIAIPTLGGLMVLVLFGRRLLALFGDEFVAGYPALIVLGVGYAVNALAGPMSYVLQIAGLERAYLRVMTLSYIGVILFQLAAIPLLGTVGAALGSALGFLAWNLWSRHVAMTRIGVDPTILAAFRRDGAAR